MKNDIKISGASLSGLEITDATEVSPASPILPSQISHCNLQECFRAVTQGR